MDTEKQKKFEAEVAQVRAGTADLIEARTAAVARRVRLKAEYEAACELVAECTLDVKLAAGEPGTLDRVVAAVLGVSRGTVAHQVAVARALRGGAAKPARDRGGRSPREKRRAALRGALGNTHHVDFGEQARGMVVAGRVPEHGEVRSDG